ncbi:hypothetical protein MRX96_044915 [Rhipicephalus microplus]
MVTRPTFFVAREMNPSTDEPSGKNDSSPKKETPEAGTEDIGADKSEDAEEDADECPITEQFFRSDVDDLLDTPNENQPLEFASFSDDFDIVETTKGGLCDSRGHRRHHTRNQRHSFPHRHRGKTAIGQSEKEKRRTISYIPFVTSREAAPTCCRQSFRQRQGHRERREPTLVWAPVATSTAVTRGPRPHAKPAPARSGRDANPKEQPSGANSLNQSPAPSLRSLAPNQRSAHKPAHYQGPVSDYFSPDTTQTPPSLASLMSPATGGLVPQVSHTNGHRTGPVAQSTRRRSSATASHHRRDSNGRRRSLRRQSRRWRRKLIDDRQRRLGRLLRQLPPQTKKSKLPFQASPKAKQRSRFSKTPQHRQKGQHTSRAGPKCRVHLSHILMRAIYKLRLTNWLLLTPGHLFTHRHRLPTGSTTGSGRSAACRLPRASNICPQLRFRVSSMNDHRNI